MLKGSSNWGSVPIYWCSHKYRLLNALLRMCRIFNGTVAYKGLFNFVNNINEKYWYFVINNKISILQILIFKPLILNITTSHITFDVIYSMQKLNDDIKAMAFRTYVCYVCVMHQLRSLLTAVCYFSSRQSHLNTILCGVQEQNSWFTSIRRA